MAKEIIVPPLGESVSEATIAKWLKKEGESVQADETIVELETDKVTLEVNAPVAGVLSTIKVAAGGRVSVGDVMGLIEAGAVASVSAPASAPTPAPAPVSAPAPVMAPAPAPIAAVADKKEYLSPAVSKMVAENQVRVGDVQASGKDGRLTKGDVVLHLEKGSAAPAVSLEMPAASALEERVRMSRLRVRIAERLKDAQNTAAMLTTFNEIDMSAAMALRARYKDAFEKKHGVRLGFMSFFTKAAVLALKEIPAVNAEIDGEDILYKYHYDIGVAVSAPQGLVVPVIRNADALSFAGIEKSLTELGGRAREGKLTMAELTGGTFTITNGGTFGSLMSTPILNPPQSGILGMHKIQERPMAVEGKIEIRPMMYVALTYDHRIIDGKEAVTFLVRIKESIENPERLILDL